MNDSVLPELARALGIAVIERLPNAGYIMAAPAPDWLAGALGPSNTLPSAFPFLRHFLKLASAAWHDGSRIDSGPFEATIDGEHLLLRAAALTVDTHKLLIVERLTGDADMRPILQRAREHLLEREQLELHATRVHAPAAAIARDLAALAALPLSPEARRLVETLTKSSAALEAAVAPLPQPPARGRGSRRR